MRELLAAPASYFQRLHLERSYDEGRLAHNGTLLWRLSGSLDVVALRQALAATAERHEILRSGLRRTREEIVQVIAPTVDLPIPTVDLRNIVPTKRWRALDRFVREETTRAFHLTSPPLLRVTLARLTDREHVLVITTSHAIWDGWSTSIALNEISTSYGALASRVPLSLPALKVQFADHVAMAQRLQHGTTDDSPPDCRLRFSRARLNGEAPTSVYRAASHLFTAASPRVKRELQLTASRQGATLGMAVLAAFAVLLRVALDEEPAWIALNEANRDNPSSRRLIGPFLSFLLVPVAVDESRSHADALSRTRDSVMDAYTSRRFVDEHSRSFEERSSCGTPVIHDAWLNFFPFLPPFAATYQRREVAGVRIESLGTRGASEPPWNDGALGLTVLEVATGKLEATFVYDASLLSNAEVAELATIYRRTLASLALAPERLVGTAARRRLKASRQA